MAELAAAAVSAQPRTTQALKMKLGDKKFSSDASFGPLLTVFILCSLSQPAMSAEPDMVAKAAVLMEMRTGNILWAKNRDLPRAPASTAKILTAAVVLDRVALNEVVTLPIAKTPPSKSSRVSFQGGERLSVHDLLYALLLQSSNDAALAMASHVAGSTPKFVQLMNQKAKSVGALRSQFHNPTGLPQTGQITTARDLALITKTALANPEFRRIVATKSYPWKSSKWEGVLENSNKLLQTYDGAIGVKTGNTREAGYCLVAAAQRGDKALIAVILGSQEKHVWQDAKHLLDYGFQNLNPAATGNSRTIP